MNFYLLIIVGLILFEYLFNVLVEILNLRHAKTEIPGEFKGVYDAEKYAQSQQYLKDNTRFDLFTSTLMIPITVAFILLGGFGVVDEFARSSGRGMIWTGLIFAGILIIASQIIQVPFSIYSTFVLEERYGFNKTKPLTFIADQLKSLVLTLVLGGVIFAGILWFFSRAGSWAWLYSWLAVTLVQFILIYVAPVFIMPLFNKFTPLEDGELKESISSYADKQGFTLKGIFKMDGSKRSTKTNAYFTGFGRWRRIVLFDTLIEKHSIEELVGVLAHEVGHYKLKHIQKHIMSSVLSSGLMFFILSLFITQPGLYQAFSVDSADVGGYPPIYAGMLFFGFLYTPISMILSIYENRASRRHEYQADAYAVNTSGHKQSFIQGLKRLSVDNLSNLTPHPLKVFLEYSHPPILARIQAIRKA